MRRKIGLLVPSGNTTFEPDFMSIVPEGVTLHSMRIHGEKRNEVEAENNIDNINDKIEEFTKILAHINPEVITYGFTTGSFYRGVEYALSLKKKIEKQSNSYSVVASIAILDALKFFNTKKISIITPYLEWNNIVLKDFFDRTDYDIISLKGDNRPQSIAIEDRLTNQEPEEVLNYILANYDKNADTVLLPCTAWRTFEIVDILERETGLKVITANQAVIWSTFKYLKMSPKNNSISTLFKRTNFEL